MGETGREYLRVFDAHGNWIHRVDLMVIAVACDPVEPFTGALYQRMVHEDETNPPELLRQLSVPAWRALNKHIKKRESLHILAGEIVLEMARMKLELGSTPSLGAARRLVAFNHREHIGSIKDSTKELSVERDVQRGFTKYRDVSHLWAGIIYTLCVEGEFVHDEAGFNRLLGRARKFEQIMDLAAAGGSFLWLPKRVPERICAADNLYFPKLTRFEIGAAFK